MEHKFVGKEMTFKPYAEHDIMSNFAGERVKVVGVEMSEWVTSKGGVVPVMLAAEFPNGEVWPVWEDELSE